MTAELYTLPALTSTDAQFESRRFHVGRRTVAHRDRLGIVDPEDDRLCIFDGIALFC